MPEKEKPQVAKKDAKKKKKRSFMLPWLKPAKEQATSKSNVTYKVEKA